MAEHAASIAAALKCLDDFSGRYIAVLPLQVLGDESQLGYLAQGIQDALSTKLFQLKDIHVTGTDAAARVDQKLPLEKIGKRGQNG